MAVCLQKAEGSRQVTTEPEERKEREDERCVVLFVRERLVGLYKRGSLRWTI